MITLRLSQTNVGLFCLQIAAVEVDWFIWIWVQNNQFVWFPKKMWMGYKRSGQAILIPMSDVYKDPIPMGIAYKYHEYIPIKNSDTTELKVREQYPTPFK